jgi:RsmE family RNA methyltransferase
MQKSVNRVVLEVTAKEPAPGRPLLDLVLAVPRPIMLKKIFTQAASLGVGHIFLVNANRVEKSFFSASLLQDNNYRKYLLHGLEQSVDTMLPSVSIHKRFRPFLEDELPELMHDYSACLVAHPDAPLLHKIAADTLKGAVLLAVGPEGGWIDFEVEKFREQDFTEIGLGKRILRVDTAVVSLCAQLSFLKKLGGGQGRA